MQQYSIPRTSHLQQKQTFAPFFYFNNLVKKKKIQKNEQIIFCDMITVHEW